MISRDQVMPLLLEACPSFGPKWEEHLEYYDDEPLLYIDLAEFARHLVALHKSKETREFPKVFGVVERLHIEGDPFVKEAATIGLLEGIQNNAEHNDVDPEVFVQYLRRESLSWWLQLNDFWEGKIPYVGATRNQ